MSEEEALQPEDVSVKELHAQASDLGIEGHSSMNKAELLEAVNAAQSADPETRAKQVAPPADETGEQQKERIDKTFGRTVGDRDTIQEAEGKTAEQRSKEAEVLGT